MKKWILITLISMTAAWIFTAYVPSVQAAEQMQAKEKKDCISPAAAKLTF
ncbi:hypothetical protein [Paenibacillus sp. H1-7]